MFDRYSGFVRCFCRERSIRATRRPVARAFLAPGLADAPLSPRPHFRFCRPGRGTSPDDTRGIRLSFSLSFFGTLPELQPAGGFHRKPSAADRKIVAFGCRIGPEYRLLSGRSGSRPAPEPPPRRRHPIPLGRIRQSYVSLCGGHTRPGVAISPNRGLRPADRVSDRLPVTRSPPTEGSSCAKAKASETRNPVRQGI